jgi:lipopolysaccharide export system protein LptA
LSKTGIVIATGVHVIKNYTMRLMRTLLCFVCAISATVSFAQEKNAIELLGAKDLKFDKRMGIDAQRLIGDVRFRHKGALMWCDSAYLYNATNSLDAFGNVRVLQGDTLDLLSDKLFYDGNTQLVKVRNNVLLKDKEMTLTTNILDFDRNTGIAVFYDEGRITSKANDNELISCEGVYNSNTEYFFFREEVVLINPKYQVETDTLNYDNRGEIAYFEGPTFIYSEENTIYCENGWYNTQTDISQFNENAFLDNGQQVLRGDSLWYARMEGLGRAYINVSIVDTAERYIIDGQYGRYFEKIQKSIVTGLPRFIQYDDRDSLFLHGDTLMAMGDSINGDKIFAYYNVRFFRKDMQGVADSLVYSKGDSLIEMYREPVLWSESLQISGDTIRLKTTDTGVERLYVFPDAFMIDKVLQDDSLKYNQIKGKHLTGYLTNNELYKVLIKGNGQSLYYAAEERRESIPDSVEITPTQTLVGIDSTDGSRIVTSQKIMGVNKAICSNIAIYLENKKVQRIRFLVKPDGQFTPIHKFDLQEAFFEGFIWREGIRPQDKNDIFPGEREENWIPTPPDEEVKGARKRS